MSTQVDIPGYVAGTWAIDVARSEVSFRIRQAGISSVRGSFDDFEGTIVTAEDPRNSSVHAVVRTASVNTRNKRRDEHLRSKDFLDVARHPTIEFSSTGVRMQGAAVLVDGDLTVLGVTAPLTLALEVHGFGTGQDGTPVARFSASTGFNRDDYGVTCGSASFGIGKKLAIVLSIEAGKQR